MTSSLYIKEHYNYVKRKKKKRERQEPPIATSKVIRITESGKFFLVESASQDHWTKNQVEVG